MADRKRSIKNLEWSLEDGMLRITATKMPVVIDAKLQPKELKTSEEHSNVKHE